MSPERPAARAAGALLVLGVLLTAAACAGARHGASAPAGRSTAEAPGAGPAPALAPPPAVSLAPPAAAAGGDYRIAPKDQLTIEVYGEKGLGGAVRVSETGTITLPFLGELPAAGLSPRELEEKIEAGLKGRYLLNPRVTVSVSEFRGRQIAVMGAVNQPGAYPLKTNYTTVLGAISEAKGVKDGADRIAYVLRARPRDGEPQPVTVDLDALLRSASSSHNVVVEAGDSVYVPEANVYYVAGEVEKRGVFTLRRDTTLSKAITEAGGATKTAAIGNVKVIRTLPSGEKQEIDGIDLDAVMKGDRRQDLPLQARDVVVVPRSGAKTAAYGFLDVLKSVIKFGIFAF